MDDKTTIYWLGRSLAERTAERDQALGRLEQLGVVATKQQERIVALEQAEATRLAELEERRSARARPARKAPRKRT